MVLIVKFSSACSKFLYYQVVIGNQKASILAYKSHLKPFELFCNDCDIKNITYKMYCEYIVFLSHKNISSVTIHDYAKDFKILLKWLYKHKYIKTDIAYCIEKLPKRKSVLPMIVSATTIKKILDTAKKDDFLQIRNDLILILCFDCGLRLSELTRLYIKDFDLENFIIRVTGKWNKQRNVPLTDTTLVYLKKYLELTGHRQHGKLFLTVHGEPITNDCIRTVFKRLKKKYNLQEFHPHLLRHSFATLFLLNGGDALVLQEILGHTTLEMTKNYVHIANSLSMAKNKRFSPLSTEPVDNEKAYRSSVHGSR